MTIILHAAASAAGRVMGAAIGLGAKKVFTATAPAGEAWERKPDAFRSGGQTYATPPRPTISVPRTHTSSADGEAVRCSGPAAEEPPRRTSSPTTPAGAGASNVALATLLREASYGIRMLADTRETDLGRDYWKRFAAELDVAASALPAEL